MGRWSKEVPKEAGYYWARHRGCEQTEEPVQLHMGFEPDYQVCILSVSVFGEPGRLSVGEIALWGPRVKATEPPCEECRHRSECGLSTKEEEYEKFNTK